MTDVFLLQEATESRHTLRIQIFKHQKLRSVPRPHQLPSQDVNESTEIEKERRGSVSVDKQTEIREEDVVTPCPDTSTGSRHSDSELTDGTQIVRQTVMKKAKKNMIAG